jgi:hypothetical protein
MARPRHWHPGTMRQWSYYYAFDNPTWSMSQYPYPVTLDWAKRPTMETWNEICAWTIEHFGLPGIRYQTEVSTERMTWYFQDAQDQLIMTVAWGNDNG